jgi:hypothetical protein
VVVAVVLVLVVMGMVLQNTQLLQPNQQATLPYPSMFEQNLQRQPVKSVATREE